jgi:hypothetical protein
MEVAPPLEFIPGFISTPPWIKRKYKVRADRIVQRIPNKINGALKENEDRKNPVHIRIVIRFLVFEKDGEMFYECFLKE